MSVLTWLRPIAKLRMLTEYSDTMPIMKFTDDPLFKELQKLNLPAHDFAIFGSGPLFVRSLRESIHDLDIIARGEAWKKAAELGEVEHAQIGSGNVIKLLNGQIELFNKWGPQEWNTDDLIDTADLIDGIRFVTLKNVLRWKNIMKRPKDFLDIDVIENFLKTDTSAS